VICDDGYEMSEDDGRCHDINECLSSPCANTMKCENTPGSYRCVEGCDPGYTWSIKHAECRGMKIFCRAIVLFCLN